MTAAVDRMEAAATKLIAQRRALGEENATLKSNAAAAEKKLQAAEQQVRQMAETANALQKKFEDTKRRCDELEHQAHLSATDTERVRLSLQTREAEMQSTTDALAESQRDVERLRAENAALADERNEARRAVEAVEHESGSYAQLLAQRDAVIAAREEEINQLASQVEQGSQTIAELKTTLEQYRGELAQLGESNGHGALPLFSDEERAHMTLRIKEIVGKLDRYLA